MKEEGKQFTPYKKFRAFKGVYIEQTKEYFLCDFYELRGQNGIISFSIEANLAKEKFIFEFTPIANSDSWKSNSNNCSSELEKLLTQHIHQLCLK